MPENPGQMPLFDLPGGEPQPAPQPQVLLDEAKAANRELVTQLAHLKRRPDPNAVLLTRLNLLIDMLMPSDGERLEFETQFEHEMTRLLQAWVEQARQMMLAADVPLTPTGQRLIAGSGFIAP